MSDNYTHLTWSNEPVSGRCPCGSETILVCAPSQWAVADGGDYVEVHDEVTGHYCPACWRLVSLSLNTVEPATQAVWIVTGKFLGLVDIREEFASERAAESRLDEYCEIASIAVDGARVPNGEAIGLAVKCETVAV